MIPSFVTVRAEARANTTAGNTQEDAFVLPLPDGGFRILWESLGQDGSGLGVYGREFSTAGSAETGEFRINGATAGTQQNVSAAILPDGSGVYVWEGVQNGSTVTFTRRFDGGTLAGELVAFDDGEANSENPVVIGLADNDWAYFITNRFGTGSDSNFALGVQIDGASTGFDGLERSRSPATLSQAGVFTSQPDAAPLKDGGLVWVWNEATDLDGTNGFIRGEILTDFVRGDPVSFDIDASGRLGPTRAPQVEVLANGNIAVTWMELNLGSGASLDYDILMQVLGPDGAPLSALTRVHTASALPQAFPDIAALKGGGFVVTWTDFAGADGGGTENPAGILARAFDNRGEALGRQVRVNDTAAGNQEDSSVDVLSDGTVVVSWESDQSGTPDVFFKLLELSIFGGAAGQTMRGTGKADAIDGGGGKDRVLGLGGNDSLEGGDADDTVIGAGGRDSIAGGSGNDRLEGGKGDDSLDGAAGTDVMKGGGGRDSFVFYAGRDRILDFRNDQDSLFLFDDLAGGLTLKKLGRLAEPGDGEIAFDFGGGTTLVVQGIASWNALKDDIVLF